MTENGFNYRTVEGYEEEIGRLHEGREGLSDLVHRLLRIIDNRTVNPFSQHDGSIMDEVAIKEIERKHKEIMGI